MSSRRGLLLVSLGITGLILALLISVTASGRDVALEPYTVAFNSNRGGRVFDMLGLRPDKVYVDVVVEFRNRGSTGVFIEIGESNFTLKSHESKVVSIYNLLDRMTVIIEDNGGLVDARVSAVIREGINPVLSIAALILMFLSMAVAGYGLIIYAVWGVYLRG